MESEIDRAARELAAQELAQPDRLVKLEEVVRLTSFSRATVLRRRRAGQFPQGRVLGPGRVGFLLSEIRAWMAGLPVTR